ncbi:MAG: DsbA family protein [Herminiimonas sp.]|nr:DsbA family protein [Herminiimonas sp.]
MATLIYIADPLCSWCYGFGPELAGLLTGLPGLPIQFVVGGLRAYNKESMDQTQIDTIRSHWKAVEASTSLPFRNDGLLRTDFIYDTEPACRAVKAAEILAPATVFDVFHSIQHAFYADSRDMTQGSELAAVASAAMSAAGTPTDAAAFLQVWEDAATVRATGKDFLQTQRWGIDGFPTLVLERDGQLDLVTSGYMRTEALVEKMQALVDTESDAAA